MWPYLIYIHLYVQFKKNENKSWDLIIETENMFLLSLEYVDNGEPDNNYLIWIIHSSFLVLAPCENV